MAKQQFLLDVRNSITRKRLIVKRPENLEDAIEFSRLSEITGRTVRGNPPLSNKNDFVVMPFHNSNYSRIRNNFESPGSTNFNRNNFYSKKKFNENFKNYIACSGFGSWQPQTPPQRRTCYKCGKLGHLANKCRSMPPNMVGHSVANDKQKSVLMSTVNRGQVPHTKTLSFKFTIM